MPAMIVIGGPGKKIGGAKPTEDAEPEGDEEEAPSSRQEARQEAAKAVMRAIKMGEVKALDEALEAYYQACEGSGAEE
jgi:hypothetical protein